MPQLSFIRSVPSARVVGVNVSAVCGPIRRREQFGPCLRLCRGISSRSRISVQSAQNVAEETEGKVVAQGGRQQSSPSGDARAILEERVSDAVRRAFGAGAAKDLPLLQTATREDFGDYQCNAAMALAKIEKAKPRDVATKIVEELEVADICLEPEIAGPGFINLTLSPQFINDKLKTVLKDTARLGIARKAAPQRIVVDFSAPNIAKEMHVGHLRSTIIGESLARMLEFLGHDVVRLNHVGDWGTQFGMLILHLKQTAPEVVQGEEVDIGDLVEFYKKAKVRFDEEEEFRNEARREVVKLQSGDDESITAWKTLCEQSRQEFNKIYSALGVTLEERGESFYNPFLGDVIENLEEQGLAVEDDGALVVFLEGFLNRDGNPQPLIVQKSDKGYMYSTTDLAAVRHRVGVERAERVLYVTDVGQSTHFEQVFQVAKRANWVPPNVSLEHVPFGLVLGEDGKKFKTRSGDTVKLKDLLSEAVTRAETDFRDRITSEGREETEEYIQRVSNVIGMSAVIYADLKSTRTANYKFSFDKMLALQGNTAPYMLYSYARIQGISRKVGSDQLELDSVEFILDDVAEKSLARQLIRLPEVLLELEKDLKPSTLCEYLFELCQKFNQFYERCSISNAETEALRNSRLALAMITARTLKLSLNLLAIEPLDRL